ncbi:hypothetical protein SELMODRAFT_450178 [Selaginella moellendorffii]|uniref:Potassium channel domain-containing protein n=2 Tax=Selaginella moellendorffii TaxID=88036 RepID=D8RPY3_SELML|nr:two-pore potassium channel 5 [Selaginella moellendorffii]EFJ25761.1 hypothetical protein SELMODRAFT_450178 [Selaginella moellendorffii]|eukprot:XP_002973387.1 two-pore potassium channel 5 [Selaginella moellendorffii]
MEQPLLGSQRRPFSLHRLVVEDEAAAPGEVAIPITPLAFKEKLVYGSLESPAGFYLPRLFNACEGQDETEDFLSQGGSRRAYNLYPTAEEKQWMLYSGKSRDDEQDEETPMERRGSSFFGGGDETTGLLATLSGLSSECSETLEKLPDAKECDHPGFPVKRKYLKKSRTAPALNVNYTKRDKSKKLTRPKLESATTVVVQASIGLMIYLAIGVAIYVWRTDDFSGSSTYPVIDALYFCIVTMCTIGYGDITPTSPSAKLFACFFVLVGFGFIDILLSGMVAYVLERQEHLLLSAVEGSHHETAKNYVVNTEKGRMRIRMKVGLALGVVFFCLAIGTLFMHWMEELGWLDSFYLSTMSVTTVGYGDHTFKTFKGRLFAAGWLLVSTLAVARSFLFLAEARIDKRNRLIAKWVLHREMTVADLVAADMDNNGFVTKSEYVIYKLKEMGKISEKEIMDVCRQFNVLDKDCSGRITISCLVNEENTVQ